ncbi:GIY-YIG catalytic domain-containing endonuclease [Paramecium bursaria Chlorella virus Can18-4]|nr:GIY-YIG catalytic domain-containing endonuclease [Paramecium bursaria Chlorella virus Can18-4]
MGFVYKLTYKKSRKAYIGQTIRDIEERLKEHQLESSGCRAISGAIKKHGWENFDKEWYEVQDEDLNFYEEMLVALLGTLAPRGYNLREGGGSTGKPSEESRQKMSKAKSGEKHPMYGKEHTEETKRKMSEALIGEKNPMYGQTLSDEHKQKISKAHTGMTHTEESKRKMSEALIGEKNPMYGQTLSDEHKQKISKAHTGKILTKETKQKISEANSGEKHPMYGRTGENNPNYGKTHTEESKRKMSEAQSGEKHHASKKVYQYTIDGIYVDEFCSFGEAARSLNKTYGSLIGLCAGGKRKDAYGFKWSCEKL